MVVAVFDGGGRVPGFIGVAGTLPTWPDLTGVEDSSLVAAVEVSAARRAEAVVDVDTKIADSMVEVLEVDESLSKLELEEMVVIISEVVVDPLKDRANL